MTSVLILLAGLPRSATDKSSALRRLWRAVACFGVLTFLLNAAVAADLRELWKDRLKSVVAVEFFTESELDRRPTVTNGVVADDQGLIIVQAGAMNPRFAPDQFKDFRVYLPGEPPQRFWSAVYLGQDVLSGWHFLRVVEDMRPFLAPITRFVADRSQNSDSVQIAQRVWGIGLRGKDEDFMPYFLEAPIGLIQTLPQRSAICLDDITAQGLPVFDEKGAFAGLGIAGFGQTYMQFSQRDRGGAAVVMVNIGETSAFLLAAEVLPYLGRIPTDIFGRPVPWLGAHGLQPIDPEVLTFLKLDSGCVVSEVLAGSPAEKAGMKDRDMIVAIDGKPLPRLKPDRVVVAYVQREISRRRPGDGVALAVQRGNERLDFQVTLVEEPKMAREASRSYFERLGFTAREFVYADGVGRRAPVAEHTGVVAHFVKANSPAATAGLGMDDWIKEIDGIPVATYADAAAQLSAIEKDLARVEAVLLIRRGGETQVLRIKLK